MPEAARTVPQPSRPTVFDLTSLARFLLKRLQAGTPPFGDTVPTTRARARWLTPQSVAQMYWSPVKFAIHNALAIREPTVCGAGDANSSLISELVSATWACMKSAPEEVTASVAMNEGRESGTLEFLPHELAMASRWRATC